MSTEILKNFGFYRQVPGHGRSERLPLIQKRPRQALAVAAAMQYEDILSDLERAMREGDTPKVRELAVHLSTLGEELRQQPGLAEYLEKGGYGAAARERLRKKYISEYVMLRGGAGPPEASPDGVDGAPLADPGTEYLSELTDAAVRHGFVQKVYAILFVQLVITAVIGGVTMSLLDGVSESLVSVLFWLSFVMLIATMCICACNPELMRSFPANYAILLVFTMAESILVGIIGTRYTAESVLIVVVITAVVVLGLSIFACQTSYDFTGWGPYLLCALLVLCGVSFCFMIGALLGMASSPAFKALHLMFAAFGALLFSFYIIHDTQLIMGGKHTTMFTVDDYCMAALALYMDIIQLFLHLLALFGDRK